MTLPAEIRMKIWRYAVPYEVELHINNSSIYDLAGSTPTNPAIPLLLTRWVALHEVSELPQPTLTAKSSGNWVTNFSAYMEGAVPRVKQAISRVTFVLSYPVQQVAAKCLHGWSFMGRLGYVGAFVGSSKL